MKKKEFNYWHFDEDKKHDALAKYDELEHAVLIWSQHWASKGYWVESPKNKKLDKMDHIIKQK